MSELRFNADGLTQRQYRRWRRLSQQTSIAATIPALTTLILVFYVASVTAETIISIFLEKPIDEVVLSGAFAEISTPKGSSFQLSVSPLDADRKIVSAGVDLSNFAFTVVSVADISNPRRVVVEGSAVPTDLAIVRSNAKEGLRILMLLDSSGSMEKSDPRDLRLDAGKQFVSKLTSGVEVAVMDFRALYQDFTAEFGDLHKAIDRIGADGGTPLFTKLKEAIMRLSASGAQDRAVLVLTDGAAEDEGLWDVIALAQRSDTRIVSVGLGSGIDFSELERMAAETGGSFVRVDEAEQLQSFFDALATSVSQGRIVVEGQASFEKALELDRSYVISGALLTTIARGTETTPFQFVTKIQPEGTVAP